MPNDLNLAPPAYWLIDPLGAPPVYAEATSPTSTVPQVPPTAPIHDSTTYFAILKRFVHNVFTRYGFDAGTHPEEYELEAYNRQG
ncbi:hypothetical protein B0H17DRAFT_1190561 [Mycena rosella]|uniref:Uncharacterized protein n=1 Tax=Mycena rosella TaxID=1033263 RepID=A0AAD7MCQ4_MYCRO|nr:hypothetical protein B0H17DRAFT_1190561 [Mycena rosella]